MSGFLDMHTAVIRIGNNVHSFLSGNVYEPLRVINVEAHAACTLSGGERKNRDYNRTAGSAKININTLVVFTQSVDQKKKSDKIKLFTGRATVLQRKFDDIYISV